MRKPCHRGERSHAPAVDPQSCPDPDISALIRAAADRWGVGFELKMLAQSWGDTLDDAEMFDVMTTFSEKGIYLSQPQRMVDPHNSDRTI